MTPKPKLIKFLMAGGAEILSTTNDWEIARFQTPNGKCVIYKNKKGSFSYSNDEAQDAHRCFLKGKPWSVMVKTNRIARKQVEELLLTRDGHDCWLCGKPMGDDITLEHILPVSCGGNNHPANLALVHSECNKEAADMPIVAKIDLRELLRGRQ